MSASSDEFYKLIRQARDKAKRGEVKETEALLYQANSIMVVPDDLWNHIMGIARRNAKERKSPDEP